MILTREVEVRAKPLGPNARERRPDRPHGNLAHGVLETYTLHRIIVTESFDGLRSVQGPERGEAALLEEAVECDEHAELRWERVRLVRRRGRGGTVIEERDAEVEVGERR